MGAILCVNPPLKNKQSVVATLECDRFVSRQQAQRPCVTDAMRWASLTRRGVSHTRNQSPHMSPLTKP